MECFVIPEQIWLCCCKYAEMTVHISNSSPEICHISHNFFVYKTKHIFNVCRFQIYNLWLVCVLVLTHFCSKTCLVNWIHYIEKLKNVSPYLYKHLLQRCTGIIYLIDIFTPIYLLDMESKEEVNNTWGGIIFQLYCRQTINSLTQLNLASWFSVEIESFGSSSPCRGKPLQNKCYGTRSGN